MDPFSLQIPSYDESRYVTYEDGMLSLIRDIEKNINEDGFYDFRGVLDYIRSHFEVEKTEEIDSSKYIMDVDGVKFEVGATSESLNYRYEANDGSIIDNSNYLNHPYRSIVSLHFKKILKFTYLYISEVK